MDLNGKKILITGATSGIGYAIAKQALALGASVGLHGRSLEKAETACKMLNHKNAKGNIKPIFGALDKGEAYKSIIAQMADAFGTLDGLVNNAGIFPRNNIDSATFDDFDMIMNINLRAPMFLIKEALPLMRKNAGKSAIVNIGSVNAHCGQDDLLIYSASKGALQTMTRNMADGLSADNIRINQVNVGWTHSEKENETQLSEGRPADWYDNIPKLAAPFGKILSPEQVAEHVIFWLSDASYPVNGQTYECEQYPLIGRNKLNAIEI